MAKKAEEKARLEEFKQRAEKTKAAAAKIKIDREFWAKVIANEIYYSDKTQSALEIAYKLSIDVLKSEKSLRDYLTRNKSVNLEEVFKFLTLWEN